MAEAMLAGGPQNVYKPHAVSTLIDIKVQLLARVWFPLLAMIRKSEIPLLAAESTLYAPKFWASTLKARPLAEFPPTLHLYAKA
jgi:hypothetical protein